jgi:hypothetical protein
VSAAIHSVSSETTPARSPSTRRHDICVELGHSRCQRLDKIKRPLRCSFCTRSCLAHGSHGWRPSSGNAAQFPSGGALAGRGAGAAAAASRDCLAMAALIYGSGLRLLECAELRVKDIAFERGELMVRDGKAARTASSCSRAP